MLDKNQDRRKARCWCSVEKEFYYFDDLFKANASHFHPFRCSCEWHPQMCAGLHDASGKLVYEGDIVKASSQGSYGTFVVSWRSEGSPCFILYPAYQKGEMWHLSASNKARDYCKSGRYYDNITIIGNVFEDPELYELVIGE